MVDRRKADSTRARMLVEDYGNLRFTYRASNTIPVVLRAVSVLIGLVLYKYTALCVSYFNTTVIAMVLLYVFNLTDINLEESFMLVENTAIQLQSSSGLFNQNKSYTVIPIDEIEEIVINEGFKDIRVIYYLAIITKNADELVLPFPVSVKSPILSKF